MSNTVKFSDLSDEMQESVRRYTRLFTSPEGKAVLEDLKDRFDSDQIKRETDGDTFFCLGQRDVVRFLMHAVRVGQAHTDE